jgi:hypothetical protein
MVSRLLSFWEQSRWKTRLKIMNRVIHALLLLTLMLRACTSNPPSAVTISTHPSPTITPTTPTYGGCGYQWAYQALPDLSAEFQRAIQKLQSEATATAFAFGEDCVHTDGSSKTFLAMETDFNITLQVTELADEGALGDWIVKVMQITLNVPKEKIVGPRPGRVSIIFQSGDQNQGINFYIDQYQSLPTRLSNVEIYQALKTPQ